MAETLVGRCRWVVCTRASWEDGGVDRRIYELCLRSVDEEQTVDRAAEVVRKLGSKFPNPPFELSYPVFDGKTVLILVTVLISKSSQGETNHSISVGTSTKSDHL